MGQLLDFVAEGVEMKTSGLICGQMVDIFFFLLHGGGTSFFFFFFFCGEIVV